MSDMAVATRGQGLRVPRRAGVALAFIVLAAAFVFVARAAFVTVPGATRLSPIAISMQSSPVLPPEVQALEAQTVSLVLDRDTRNEFAAYDQGTIEFKLEGSTEVRALKVFGAAPYTLTVKALQNGTWNTVPGLDRIRLTTLPEAWNNFTATTPVTTDTLHVELTPAAGGKATGLKEIEIWGALAHGLTPNAAANPASLANLLKSTPGGTLPSPLREYRLSPADGVVNAAGFAFAFNLDRNPVQFKRAFLAYEIYGLTHWVSPVRAINGNTAQGGAFVFGNKDWSTVVEPVHPIWLQPGANRIAFSLPAGVTGTYSLRNVRVIAELDDGMNAAVNAQDTTATVVDAFNVLDGDLATGWVPYGTSGRGATSPQLTLSFDRPTVPDGVAFYLNGPLNGTLALDALVAGQWQNAGSPAVNGRQLTTGWNTIPLTGGATATALRLSFQNGTGSLGEIREILAIGSGVGAPYSPRIEVAYPDAGQYYGREAYIRGFLAATDNGSGPATLTVGGKTVPGADGAFGIVVSKEDVGLASQSDADPWSVDVVATYPNNEKLTTTVRLYQGGDKAKTQTALPGVAVPGFVQGLDVEGASLEVPPGAMDDAANIKITPLAEGDLPPLDPGMTNVTKGPHRGYRFTPHPYKFKKPVTVTIPYAKSFIPPGLSERDVKTYYFDETAGHWVALDLAKLDASKELVTSLTDHFTDMINATLVVPDHPQAVNFNPTQIKDIKAADPGAGINLIEPPKVNNQGDARLSYPIEIPPGRAGMQPQLAIQYSSGGGNGWLGLGWDLSVPSISVETRWGAPRYDTAKETETYLLNGEQLTPLAHRGEPVDRTAEKIFHTRVEGPFRKIVRHGASPADYWWEVTEKNGMRHFYGGDGTGQDAASVLGSDKGVFKWSLRKSIDTNGNAVSYTYVNIQDSGIGDGTSGVAGHQLYVKEIRYTGQANADGPYAVTFIRDRDLGESRRTDVAINARGGFKQVTADRLRKIEVKYNGALVRHYELKYREGAFTKTLLVSASQWGADGAKFNEHSFDYFDEIRDGSGDYAAFGAMANWTNYDDQVRSEPYYSSLGQASAISGQRGTTVGGHLYLGIGVNGAGKSASSGYKTGYSDTTSEGALELVDVDGDGLADKVFRTGSYYSYRRNLGGPNGQYAFSDIALPVPIPGLQKEKTTTRTTAFEHHGIITRLDTFTNSHIVGSTYLVDANADGFTDVVVDGRIYYGYRDAQGKPAYTTDSNLTPAPVTTTSVTTDWVSQEFLGQFNRDIDTFPLVDTLRRWTAPFDGTVKIGGTVQLLKDTSAARNKYETADGVRVAIQLEDSELWSQDIGPDQYSPVTPTGVEAIPVSRGQRLYFRVQSKFDGAYDQVSWNPAITYDNSPVGLTDANALDSYCYQAGQDFVLAGRPSTITVPVAGTLRFTGRFEKRGITTDDVTVLILKNDAPLIPAVTIPWNEIKTIDYDQQITVSQKDKIVLQIKVDSSIDLRQLSWTPQLVYVAMDGANPPGGPDGGTAMPGLKARYDIDTYPADALTAPQSSWKATKTGTLYVKPFLDIGLPGTVPEVTFTVKRRGALVAKKIFTMQNGAIPPGTMIPVTVTQDDELFFDFSSRDKTVDVYSAIANVSVTYDDPSIVMEPVYINAPSAFHRVGVSGALPVPYRGWAVAAYNGNRDRALKPINQSELGSLGSYDASTAAGYDSTGGNAAQAQKSYPMLATPLADKNGWDGPNDSVWVRGETVSASRLGPTFIGIPNAGAGQVAVNRIVRSNQYALTQGPGNILTKGDTRDDPITKKAPHNETLLDFMDMNGDGLPDVVGGGNIRYTRPTGEYEQSPVAVSSGYVRGSGFSSHNISTGATSPTGNAEMRNSGWGIGDIIFASTDMPGFGLGINADVGNGDSVVQYNMVDMNGDGLPDRVTQAGSKLWVGLNLGYGFADLESWGDAPIGVSLSNNSSLGGGYNEDEYSFAGGYTAAKSHTYMTQGLIDVNGDGLPDHVTATDAGLRVRLNTGTGFGPIHAWGGAVYRSSGSLGVNGSESGSSSWGAFYTYNQLICNCEYVSLYFVINPGVTAGTTLSRQEMTLKDIDGDGYPDQLASGTDGELRVGKNRTGRTNLLKSVQRPLGARIDLDYERSGNTKEQPGSRWVMAKVSVNDGVVGDGADTLVTTYRYEDGRQDRREREFLGYAKVTTEQRDASQNNTVYRTLTQEYLTDSVYTKGLLKRERSADGANQPYLETENTFALRDVETGAAPADATSITATIFPQLVETTRRFHEGSPSAQKATSTTFAYDDYGNVTRFVDTGDAGPADDVAARIDYKLCTNSYIVGKAARIVVTDASNRTLRERQGEIDCATGNLSQVRQLLENGQAAVTDLSYFPNGNLKTVTGPANAKGQRYALDYVYDDAVSTYPVSITDSFGYTSTATHDYRFGKPLSTTDLNGNVVSYAYDAFGRTVSVTGPYEQAGGQPTIRFDYHPEAPVPYAFTAHLDKDAAGKPKASGTIDTVLFTDGLKRILQTKKDATVAGQDVMIVSGRVTFDGLGRAIEQYYPITEPKGGANTALNPAFDTVTSTRTAYDVLDRVTSTTLPDNTTTRIRYGFGPDRAGQTQFETEVTDANGNTKETYRDVRDLITAVKEHNAKGNQPTLWTSYAYDSLKQIVGVLDDRNNPTQVAYDNLGRRVAIDNPDTGKTETFYDLAGNVTQKVTAVLRLQGKSIAYDYDFNRLNAIHYPLNPANDVSYTYGDAGLKGNGQNQVGRIIKVVSGGGIEGRAYGKLGELTQDTKTPNTQPASPAYVTKYAFDTFGRLMTLVFPDGETLTHTYDAGGNITRIEGTKQGATQVYLDTLHYDRFEQRTYVKFGNGIESRYTYRPDNRRLETLASQGGTAGAFQNLHYGYDPVGNIASLANQVPIPPANQYGGPVAQSFDYDNLYRLTSAEGTFTTARDARRYTLTLSYDNLHNITRKTQRDETVRNGTPRVEAKTTYDWAYAYTPATHPHAPTHIGDRTFYYDANGNQTGWTNDTNGGKRTILWDEENRIEEIADQGNTSTYKYDDQGQRAVKSGSNGEVAYINPFYVVRNSAIPTKHVYAGTTRIASKRLSGGNATTAPDTWNNTRGNGNNNPNGPAAATATATTTATTTSTTTTSANTTTTGLPGQGLNNRSQQGNAHAQNTLHNPNLNGQFPGQGINNRSSQANANAQNTNQNPNLNGTGIGGGGSGGNPNGGGNGNNAWQPEIEFLYFYHPDHLGSTSYVTDQNGKLYEHIQYFPFGESWIEEGPATRKTPYLFTSKEYDPETGLYYFGARYYDPRTSVWQSADPILGKYLPSGGDSNLAGMGGVYNTLNLGLYTYGHQNPIKLVDPDGNAVIGIPFTDKYFVFQQKPDGGYRAEITTRKEGRHINPAPGFFSGNITFVNDNPAGASPDQRVSFELADTVEGAARDSKLDINVNSTTGGHTSGQHPRGEAADVNLIGGKRVDNPKNADKVKAFQGSVAKQPNIFRNYGPSQQTETQVRKGVRKDYAIPQVAPEHQNHVHIAVPDKNEQNSRAQQ